MIVKIIPRSGDSSFARLANYIFSDSASRVALHVSGDDGVESGEEVPSADSIAEALQLIELTQGLNVQTRADKTSHLIISFPAGEIPAKEHLSVIEKEVVEAAGWGGHQRVSAVHDNTAHLHLHVAINRIHPETFRNIHRGRTKVNVQAKARELEARLGLQPLLVAKALDSGNLEQTPGEFVDLSPKSPAVRDAEIHSGRVSLVTWIQEQVAGEIAAVLASDSPSWKGLHDVLREYGLVIQPRGRGMVFATLDGTDAVKCSSISRAFSRGKMEQLLGDFAALRNRKKAVAGGKQYTRGAAATGVAWKTYRALQQTNREHRKAGFEAYKADRDRRLGALQGVYRQERQTLWARTDLTRKQKFLVQQFIGWFRAAREREIKAELRQQRAAILQSTATGSWMEYLITETNRGNRAAGSALMRTRRKTAAVPEGAIPGAYITGKGSPEATLSAVMDQFAGRFEAHKGGDLVIRSEDGQHRVILRKNRLFVDKDCPRSADFARRVAVNLFQTAFRIHEFSGKARGWEVEIER